MPLATGYGSTRAEFPLPLPLSGAISADGAREFAEPSRSGAPGCDSGEGTGVSQGAMKHAGFFFLLIMGGSCLAPSAPTSAAATFGEVPPLTTVGSAWGTAWSPKS